jgi:hypothetical protein
LADEAGITATSRGAAAAFASGGAIHGYAYAVLAFEPDVAPASSGARTIETSHRAWLVRTIVFGPDPIAIVIASGDVGTRVRIRAVPGVAVVVTAGGENPHDRQYGENRA